MIKAEKNSNKLPQHGLEEQDIRPHYHKLMLETFDKNVRNRKI